MSDDGHWGGRKRSRRIEGMTPIGIRATSLLFLLTTLACSSTEQRGTPAPVEAREPLPVTYRAAVARSGRFHVRWRPVPSPIPVNESFELDVLITTPDEAARPVEGAEVYVHGDMPAHGHGMVREPRAREVGGGRYRVLGMLLHMGGHWELSIDVIHAGVAETADFAVDL